MEKITALYRNDFGCCGFDCWLCNLTEYKMSIKKTLIILFVFLLLVGTSSAALNVGFTDGEAVVEIVPAPVPTNFSLVNVNNSQFFQGYIPSTLRSFFQTTYDTLYCLLTGCTITGDLTVEGNFKAKTYYSDDGNFGFNFYDDGSELFMNVSSVEDAFGIETENTKLILYNAPSAGNDFKVFQIFSKEAADVTEFVVTKAGEAHTSYFIRSLSLVGNGSEISTPWNCTTFADYIDCSTDITGPDFYVLDDFEIDGSLYVDEKIYVIDWTNLTGANVTFSNDLIVDGFYYGDGSRLLNLPSGFTGWDSNLAWENESNTFTEPQTFKNITIETKIETTLHSAPCFKFKPNGDVGVSLTC